MAVVTPSPASRSRFGLDSTLTVELGAAARRAGLEAGGTLAAVVLPGFSFSRYWPDLLGAVGRFLLWEVAGSLWKSTGRRPALLVHEGVAVCRSGSAVLSGHLVFAGPDENGCEPWVSDGVTAGLVADLAGSPVSPAAIRIHGGLGGREDLRVDAAGRFQCEELAAGEGYLITVSAEGFLPARLGPLTLAPGEILPLEITLVTRLGELAPEAPLDQSATSTSSRYDAGFIEKLPIIGHEYQEVLTLAPGVDEPDGDGHPNVHGARGTGLEYRVDRGDTTDPAIGAFGAPDCGLGDGDPPEDGAGPGHTERGGVATPTRRSHPPLGPGCQYTSVGFGRRCQDAGVRPSMGSVGDCFDNAMCESFFATLECELLDRVRFRTQVEARIAVFDFIEGWHNPRRRHSGIEYLSPVEFERRAIPVSKAGHASEATL